MSTDEFSEDIWVMDDRDDSPERGEWNPDPEEVPQLAPEIPTWKNGATPESSIGFTTTIKHPFLGIPHLWNPPYVHIYIHTCTHTCIYIYIHIPNLAQVMTCFIRTASRTPGFGMFEASHEKKTEVHWSRMCCNIQEKDIPVALPWHRT